MARTLNTGLGATVQFLMCVDDNNATIKDFSTNNVSVTNTGLVVTTAKTWKGVTVPMMTFADATDKLELGAETPNIVSPCTMFIITKDSAASDGLVMMYGSATAGGAADIAVDPYFQMGSNPSPVVKTASSGSAVAVPSVTLVAGDSWACFFTSNTADPNQTWFALEANALGTTGTVAPNFQFTSGGLTLNGFLKQIGTNGSPTWTNDLVMVGVLSGIISGANAAAIHADPFGTTLFLPAPTAAPALRVFPRSILNF